MPLVAVEEFTHYKKKNDTLPTIRGFLKLKDGTPINLTGATVKFIMSAQVGAVPKVSALATVITPLTGEVEYAWQLGDTDTEGVFLAEWEVTFPGVGVKRLTSPNESYLRIKISTDLG